ncbi:MAG: hypothetical protein J6X66_07765, partial [Lachnospiraceae bacterium]|nr:hypothetical protein [Lachnospiraceae bacterium]
MKENVGIVILLLVTTIVYSIVLISIRGNTKKTEDAEGDLVLSEDSVSYDMMSLRHHEEDIPIPTQAYYFATAPVSSSERHAVSTDGMVGGIYRKADKVEKPKPEELTPPPDPVNLVIDLDYNSDVDDTAALRIAAMLDRMGRVHLLAAMASTGGEKVCKAMHSQLSYDGYGGVPIGMAVKNVPGGSPYWDDLINHYFSAGDYRAYNSL